MTNLEALKAKLEGLDISDDKLKLTMTDRGIDADSIYTLTSGFELAYADCLMSAFMNPKSWSQGDMSENWDLDSLKDIASAIYDKYDVPNPLEKNPTVKFKFS